MQFDRSKLDSLISALPPEQVSAIASAFLGACTATRIAALEEALRTRDGNGLRSQIGAWITCIVPVDTLVPDIGRKWRPLVQDAMQFVFVHLSDRRLAAKLVEQIEMAPEAEPESRLLKLISKMPGLQKLGQVLARNRRLSPALRTALSELENGLSDVVPDEILRIVRELLGDRLEKYAVELSPSILREGSASAILRFSWKEPDKERERGVFKVLKPYVPEFFAEDMTLLQQLGEFLGAPERGYEFAVRDVKEMLAEVRLLLENELDFKREQATLVEAQRMYRSSFGIRVPRLIAPLCNTRITAMTEETGMKVTDACRRSEIRRNRIAGQLIEALLAVPLFSRDDPSVFHADPHAGNLMYDEPNRELVILDWALAEHLSLGLRRQVVLLAIMMTLRDQAGVGRAIHALNGHAKGRTSSDAGLIDAGVKRFFDQLPAKDSPGILDAMILLDQIALEGVHFPAPLFLFRKVVFTLDGVLQDVAGSEVRIDYVVVREFMNRWAASFGLFHAPFTFQDLAAIQWNALLYPGRSLRRRFFGQPARPI